MPREKRKISPSSIYYVFATGEITKKLAPQDEDKECLIDMFFDLKEEFDFQVYAFVVTHNEFHCCIKEKGIKEISQIFRKLFTRYSAFYNCKYQSEGKVLHDRFKSEPVEEGEALKSVIRYIHQMPPKVAEYPNVFSYKFSSYIEYYKDSLIDKEYPLSLFGEDEVTSLNKFKIYHAYLDFSNLKGNRRTRFSDEELDQILMEYTQYTREKLCEEDRVTRRKIARLLKKKTPLSLRQIEKLTKISRETISLM